MILISDLLDCFHLLFFRLKILFELLLFEKLLYPIRCILNFEF